MTHELDTLISIQRILTTPLGSRVMMPEYGSELFTLIDKPMTDEWVLDAIRYSYEAIEINEPRVLVKNVKIELGESVLFRIEYEEDGSERAVNFGFSEVSNAAA